MAEHSHSPWKQIILLIIFIIFVAILARILTSGETLSEHSYKLEHNNNLSSNFIHDNLNEVDNIDTNDDLGTCHTLDAEHNYQYINLDNLKSNTDNENTDINIKDILHNYSDNSNDIDNQFATDANDTYYNNSLHYRHFSLDDNNVVSYVKGFYSLPINESIFDRINGISYPNDNNNDTIKISLDDLRYLALLHYDHYGNIVTGELICNESIEEDLMYVFINLYEAKYRIDKICLIDDYNGDDSLSMQDNNTSCFNYRLVDGTDKLSQHAFGLAIDINPLYNPYVRTINGIQVASPKGSEPYINRALDFNYKIDEEDLAYKLLTSRGFTWGGNWTYSKDYQHFQMNID